MKAAKRRTVSKRKYKGKPSSGGRSSVESNIINTATSSARTINIVREQQSPGVGAYIAHSSKKKKSVQLLQNSQKAPTNL